jgi:hypothetical protein
MPGMAHDVAAGTFYLDDVGAVIREYLCRRRTHEHAGDVDDTNALQRPLLGVRSLGL